MTPKSTNKDEDNWNGKERRQSPDLTEEQLENLADKVADRFYLKLGKLTFTALCRFLLYILGPLCFAAYLWIKYGKPL